MSEQKANVSSLYTASTSRKNTIFLVTYTICCNLLGGKEVNLASHLLAAAERCAGRNIAVGIDGRRPAKIDVTVDQASAKIIWLEVQTSTTSLL